MTPSFMVAVAAFCVVLAVSLLVWSFTAAPNVSRKRALDILQRDSLSRSHAGGSDAFRGSVFQRAARFIIPMSNVRWLDRMLGRAGRPPRWPLERVLVVKFVATAAVLGMLVLAVGTAPSARAWVFGLAVVAFVWFLPELLIYNSGLKRRKAVSLALPDTLDQLTIAVEAGLGFEAALAHVSRNSRGALSEEFMRTLQDIQVGQPRRDAYRALTERVDVPDLRRFVRALIQAEQHGVSISRVLATQAREMRIKRRQRAEEKAMQIPVKVVFPLILFILPALFIVILGPAVINALQVFSGL